MLKKIMLALLFPSLFAFGQGSQLPKYTVATLPAASSQPHYIVQVIDGASSTDCATGGGAQNVACVNVAGVWRALGSVSPTFTGSVTAGGTYSTVSPGLLTTAEALLPSGGTLVVNNILTVPSNHTTPLNITYEIKDGGGFNISSGAVLSLNSAFSAGRSMITLVGGSVWIS